MSVLTAPNRIVLIGDYSRRYEEKLAKTGTIKPGHLIESDDDNTEVKLHATAGSFAEIMIAIEDALQGGTIDTFYTIGMPVRYVHALPGEVYYMLLVDEGVADEDDFLTSNGDGTLKVATSTDQRLFKVVEAIDTTGLTGPTRIKVRVV